MVGQKCAEAVPPGVRVRTRGLGEIAEDGHRTAPRHPAAQGAGLHGRQVLGLVGDDVAVTPRSLTRDEVAELFEADTVVQGPGVVLGPLGPGPVQGSLLRPVEDSLRTGAQQVRRVVEAAQRLPGTRRGPGAVEKPLHLAVAFQAAADRAVRPATRGQGGKFPQEPVDEQAAEAVTALSVGPVPAACLFVEAMDFGARDTQGRAAGRNGESRFVPVEGGHGEKTVDSLGPALLLDTAPQDGGHTLVGLHQPCLRRIGPEGFPVPQAGELDGVDVAGAEGGQDLADVVEEPLVRADDEHVLGLEVVVVDEPGHAVQADRGLARARPALHDEDVGRRTRDQVHLVAADGLDDVPHTTAAGALELAQQQVVGPEGLATLEPGDIGWGTDRWALSGNGGARLLRLGSADGFGLRGRDVVPSRPGCRDGREDGRGGVGGGNGNSGSDVVEIVLDDALHAT